LFLSGSDDLRSIETEMQFGDLDGADNPNERMPMIASREPNVRCLACALAYRRKALDIATNGSEAVRWPSHWAKRRSAIHRGRALKKSRS